MDGNPTNGLSWPRCSGEGPSIPNPRWHMLLSHLCTLVQQPRRWEWESSPRGPSRIAERSWSTPSQQIGVRPMSFLAEDSVTWPAACWLLQAGGLATRSRSCTPGLSHPPPLSHHHHHPQSHLHCLMRFQRSPLIVFQKAHWPENICESHQILPKLTKSKSLFPICALATELGFGTSIVTPSLTKSPLWLRLNNQLS